MAKLLRAALSPTRPTEPLALEGPFGVPQGKGVMLFAKGLRLSKSGSPKLPHSPPAGADQLLNGNYLVAQHFGGVGLVG